MKKNILYILASVVLFLTGFSKTNAQPQKLALATKAAPVSEKAKKEDNSLLWEISGKGLKEKSYLFGTIHILCPDDLVISDKIKDALNSSQRLVLELDFSNPNLMMEIQSGMIMKDGTTARDYLSASDYELVERFFKDSLNMPLEQVGIVKPFFLSSFTMMRYFNCQPASWEQTLMGLAKEKELQVSGLETVAQQLQAIEKITLQKQGQMLVEGIRDHAKSKKMFAEMVALYKQENIAALQSMTSKYMTKDYAEAERALLQERNRNWINSIQEGIQNGASFYAVGAAHLGGKEGVIALLRKQGYTVKAVK